MTHTLWCLSLIHIYPLSAGTHTAYASVGYLSPIETALYLTSTPLKPSACERLDAVVFTSAAAVVAVTVPALVAVVIPAAVELALPKLLVCPVLEPVSYTHLDVYKRQS